MHKKEGRRDLPLTPLPVHQLAAQSNLLLARLQRTRPFAAGATVLFDLAPLLREAAQWLRAVEQTLPLIPDPELLQVLDNYDLLHRIVRRTPGTSLLRQAYRRILSNAAHLPLDQINAYVVDAYFKTCFSLSAANLEFRIENLELAPTERKDFTGSGDFQIPTQKHRSPSTGGEELQLLATKAPVHRVGERQAKQTASATSAPSKETPQMSEKLCTSAPLREKKSTPHKANLNLSRKAAEPQRFSPNTNQSYPSKQSSQSCVSLRSRLPHAQDFTGGEDFTGDEEFEFLATKAPVHRVGKRQAKQAASASSAPSKETPQMSEKLCTSAPLRENKSSSSDPNFQLKIPQILKTWSNQLLTTNPSLLTPEQIHRLRLILTHPTEAQIENNSQLSIFTSQFLHSLQTLTQNNSQFSILTCFSLTGGNSQFLHSLLTLIIHLKNLKLKIENGEFSPTSDPYSKFKINYAQAIAIFNSQFSILNSEIQRALAQAPDNHPLDRAARRQLLANHKALSPALAGKRHALSPDCSVSSPSPDCSCQQRPRP